MANLYSIVIVKNAAGNIVYEDNVNIPYSPEDGILRYEFPALPVGEYEMVISHPFVNIPDFVNKVTVSDGKS